jgi:hypothetical protein
LQQREAWIGWTERKGGRISATLGLFLRKRGCLSLANDAGIIRREFQASLMLLGTLGGLG